jgi:pimeloyl-ACP methyl ester carboxylesterase
LYVDTAISIPAGGVRLEGDLVVPSEPRGVVLFAHGSGSSRHSPRNRMVAGLLQEEGFGTLLADLLTGSEATHDAETGLLRFDIDLLAGRTTSLLDWTLSAEPVLGLPIGLFGASTGAAAALVAAADRPEAVGAVVSRGGRPDLAGDALSRVRAPVLLIVGERDRPVVVLNEQAAATLTGPHRIDIVPGATHLFEEPGALAEVADRAAGWFSTHLAP